MLGALQRRDVRDIENTLVQLLDFEYFELIKELMLNRVRIVWCTRLSRAQVRGVASDVALIIIFP